MKRRGGMAKWKGEGMARGVSEAGGRSAVGSEEKERGGERQAAGEGYGAGGMRRGGAEEGLEGRRESGAREEKEEWCVGGKGGVE